MRWEGFKTHSTMILFSTRLVLVLYFSFSPVAKTQKIIIFLLNFSHRLNFCQRLSNRLLSLLFMKLHFIDFLYSRHRFDYSFILFRSKFSSCAIIFYRLFSLSFFCYCCCCLGCLFSASYSQVYSTKSWPAREKADSVFKRKKLVRSHDRQAGMPVI